jgi:hypothetical protein
MKTLVLSAVVFVSLLAPALADSRSIDLRPGFTGAPDNMSPRANPGGATGYVVPMGLTGGQAGANWTSRSGNTNVGAYGGGDMNGGYQVGASIALHY